MILIEAKSTGPEGRCASWAAQQAGSTALDSKENHVRFQTLSAHSEKHVQKGM